MDCCSVVTIQHSESTRQLIGTGIRKKPPKNFQVKEFIGYHDTLKQASKRVLA